MKASINTAQKEIGQIKKVHLESAHMYAANDADYILSLNRPREMPMSC